MLSDLTKYHGVGDTPKSNDRRPIDPVSIRDVSKTPVINGVSVGDYVAPGGGSGHVIVTSFRFDDFENNEGFKQAMDEDFRAIRELYKTVLPYPQQLFRQYVLASVSIYGAMLMLRQALASYNQTHDTIPYLHDAMVSTPSNVGEQGVVTASKIQFLEDSEIAVTLANYTFLVNRVKELVIPPAAKKYLDWLFANQFVDSSLIAPQIYVNQLVDINLYGNVNNTIDVIQTWDLRTGHLEDVLNSVNAIISLGAMINADLHKTGLMTPMLVPELKLVVRDKDYEFFNMLINAVDPNTPSIAYLPTDGANPFKEDYSRVDLVGSTDDSHIQAAAIGALRRWGKGLLVEIISQGIYIPAGTGAVAPFNKINALNNAYAQSGMPSQTVPFYIQFQGTYTNNIGADRIAANTAQTFTVDANTRIPSATYSACTLKVTAAIGASVQIYGSGYKDFVLAECAGKAKLFLHLKGDGTGTLVLEDLVNTTSYTIGNLGATNVPFNVQSVVTYFGDEHYVKYIGVTTETYSSTTAGFIAALADIFGPDGVFYYSAFEATFTKTETSVSYSISCNNPVLMALFVEQVDYHLPINYSLAVRIADNDSAKTRIGMGYIQLKESYTPLILNKFDCIAFLRFALLGMFTSGGSSVYAKPRVERSRVSNRKSFKSKKFNEGKDEDNK